MMQPDSPGAEMEPLKSAINQAANTCSCGNVFMPDSNFCRHCGKKRPIDGAPLETEPAAAHERTRGTESTGSMMYSTPQGRGPSLYLAIFSFFSGNWLNANLMLLLFLIPLKGVYFVYPPQWQRGEVAILVLCYVLRRAQQALSNFGDRARNAGALAAALALAVPVMLVVGYFISLQVYVLQLELAACSLSLALLTAEAGLTAFAGFLASTLRKETLAVCAATLLAVSAIVTSIVTTARSSPSLDTVQANCVMSLTLGLIGVCVAMVSCWLMLDLKPLESFE